jgi:hypothetical protein
VLGNSDTSFAVVGQSGSLVGVFGISNSNIGVQGISNNFVGVQGAGSGSGAVGGWFLGGRAALALGAASTPGAPTTGEHFQGDIYLDSNIVVWVCTAHGTPGTWVRLTGVPNGTTGGSMNFLPGISRIVTSGNPSDPGVPMVVGTPQTFPIAGHNGIPTNATGVFGSATCYASSGTGFVSVFPASGSATGGSLNFVASDEPLSNFVATGLGTGGQITVATFASGCKFIYDAVGYTL